jgi:hypothetical protein
MKFGGREVKISKLVTFLFPWKWQQNIINLICFAQLIPLSLDIIPVKCHEFLFSTYTILIKIVFVFYHLIGYHDNGSHFDNYKN